MKRIIRLFLILAAVTLSVRAAAADSRDERVHRREAWQRARRLAPGRSHPSRTVAAPPRSGARSPHWNGAPVAMARSSASSGGTSLARRIESRRIYRLRHDRRERVA